VADEIVRDHAVVFGDLLVFEEVAPLVVVAPGRVLANQGLPLAVLQEKDLALVAHHVDGHIASRDR
jgi:hypothetical protein